MRLSCSLFALAAAAKLASAAQSFAGSNLYYAAGLSSSQRVTLLSNMQSAGMKVLRVWLDGQSTASTKGTTITSYPSLEPNSIGTYDDTVLKLLDAFMVDARNYGIKLMISIHSFNALSGGDVYGKIYGTGYFYEQTTPQQQFDNRIRHVLNHVHTTLGKPWSQLSDYIFAFEAQNEAMIGAMIPSCKGQQYIIDHQSWQCDRAGAIKGVLGSSSGILVTTGGESWLDESVQANWLTCSAIDVIATHAYGIGDYAVGQLQTYVNRVKAAGKLMIMQEWGACYFTTENNNCPTGSVLNSDTRNNNIKTWAGNMNQVGLPWMYWQVLPNVDPHYGYDFEVGVVNDASWATLKAAANSALTSTAAFDFSKYLI